MPDKDEKVEKKAEVKVKKVIKPAKADYYEKLFRGGK